MCADCSSIRASRNNAIASVIQKIQEAMYISIPNIQYRGPALITNASQYHSDQRANVYQPAVFRQQSAYPLSYPSLAQTWVWPNIQNLGFQSIPQNKGIRSVQIPMAFGTRRIQSSDVGVRPVYPQSPPVHAKLELPIHFRRSSTPGSTSRISVVKGSTLSLGESTADEGNGPLSPIANTDTFANPDITLSTPLPKLEALKPLRRTQMRSVASVALVSPPARGTPPTAPSASRPIPAPVAVTRRTSYAATCQASTTRAPTPRMRVPLQEVHNSLSPHLAPKGPRVSDQVHFFEAKIKERMSVGGRTDHRVLGRPAWRPSRQSI